MGKRLHNVTSRIEEYHKRHVKKAYRKVVLDGVNNVLLHKSDDESIRALRMLRVVNRSGRQGTAGPGEVDIKLSLMKRNIAVMVMLLSHHRWQGFEATHKGVEMFMKAARFFNPHVTDLMRIS
jgi:hypothetical protein